jgi:hypothetical protein
MKDKPMASKTQQQEDMVNTFVASIPTMQTDIALLKQDMSAVKKTGETVLSRIDELSVVTKADFEKYKQDVDERFDKIEKYNTDNKPGVTFANALVSRWTTFLVLLLLTAAVIALVGHFIPIGG